MTMEVNYGVAITNKFALFLNEDEDPLDILRLEEELKSKKADKKKTSANDKDSKTKTKPIKASEPTVDSKKHGENVAATTGLKKEADKPPRLRGKPTQNDANAADRKPGKENDAAGRRDINRPRPQSAVNRDGATRDGGNRVERTDQTERSSYDRPNRGGPRFQRPDRGGFVERGGERPEFSVEKTEDGENTRPFGPGGRGRGGYRGRGAGGGRGAVFRGGRREFDRHSGSDRSGVKPQEKKDGAGAHNWGTITDDIEDAEKRQAENGTTWGAQMEAAESSQTTTDGAKTEGGEEGEGNAVEPAEEEPKVLTLDEWRAQQEGSRFKSEFNIRKPGEGCATDPQWKKMFVLKKKEEEAEEEEEEEDEDDEEEGHHGRQKNVVPIEIKFNVAPKRGFVNRGRGRGGRGGVAGGPGAPVTPVDEARAARGGRRPTQKAPNVSDELDFPSLH